MARSKWNRKSKKKNTHTKNVNRDAKQNENEKKSNKSKSNKCSKMLNLYFGFCLCKFVAIPLSSSSPPPSVLHPLFFALFCSVHSMLTLFGVAIPSLHFAYIHKHAIFRGDAICCTNRKVIVWTLTFTIDVLQQTNRLIRFHRCQHANTQNHYCNHFENWSKNKKMV